MILAVAERRNEAVEAVEAKLGRPLDNSHSVTVRDGVAIVPVIGPIARYADFFTVISGATSIDTLAKDFRSAIDDRSVRAIILNMDSPGGTVSGISEFASQVKAARGIKPIVCYVGSQAASAGYWIASAADQIVADSTAMLGSIGVVVGMPRKKASDPIEIVSSQSPYKRVDVETERGKAKVQATADDLADLFVDAIASNRDVPRETVLSDFGQGGSFVASKAVAAGMADGIGSLEGVIASLSRGEMPCPPRPPKPQPKAAPKKAETQPRSAAMSEKSAETIAAEKAAELQKQVDHYKALADTNAKKAEEAGATAEKAISDRIEASAESFVASLVTGKGAVATPGERAQIKAAYVVAARDDLANPVAGSPEFRQQAIKSAYGARKPHGLLADKGSSDPADQTRAMGMDPATEGDEADDKKRAEAREKRREETQARTRGYNGVAAPK